MARGKYSPTVTAAYRARQDWWTRYVVEVPGTYAQYDPDGFDQYGYNSECYDRAGNHEFDYLTDDSYDSNSNSLYDAALEDWTFDGTRPALRTFAASQCDGYKFTQPVTK